MNDWRKPCETCEGRGGFFGEFFEAAPFRGGTPWTDCEDCNGSGGSPVTAADLEGLGEKIDWCVNHDSEAMHWVSGVPNTCTRAFGTDEPCEFEGRLLIPIPDPQPATEGT